MCRKISLVLLFFLSDFLVAQSNVEENKGGVEFYIHEEVTNADGEIEQELIALWQGYISEGSFEDPNSPYWSFQNMKVPDENFWALGLETLNERDHQVQCKVIGIFQVENDHWSLISSFSHIDESGEIHLDVITAVYAKEVDGRYLLVSSAEYLKNVYTHHKVGSINYYVHPLHKFKKSEAQQMLALNKEMSNKFGVEPISFDYYAASNARDISRTWGYEYMNRMYNPSGKGGVASWQNMIIYSGNNSSYFPHELVHLYTFQAYPDYPHFWVGEGIATFFAGTSTYTFSGHMEKLKAFLSVNPDYDLSDISKLNVTIPNGEHKSDLRYVIGGLLMRDIHAKEGMKGLIESLKYGAKDEDFWRLLEEKLEVSKNSFDAYVKRRMIEW